MGDDYVWERTGDADPDLVSLERTLGTLRHRAPLGELPTQRLELTESRPGWARPVLLGALLSSTLTVLLIWVFLRVTAGSTALGAAEPDTVAERTQHALPVAAPPRETRRARRDRAARLELLVAETGEILQRLNEEVERLEAANTEAGHKRDAGLRRPVQPVPPTPRRQRPAPRRPRRERASATPTVDCILDPQRCHDTTEAATKGVERDKLSPSDIKQGIGPIKDDVEACGRRYGGLPGQKLTIKFSIEGSSGRVTKASALGSFRGTPLGRCAAEELLKARFPRFRKTSLGVQYPFRL